MHLNIETIHIAGTSLKNLIHYMKPDPITGILRKKQLAQYRHEQSQNDNLRA